MRRSLSWDTAGQLGTQNQATTYTLVKFVPLPRLHKYAKMPGLESYALTSAAWGEGLVQVTKQGWTRPKN